MHAAMLGLHLSLTLLLPLPYMHTHHTLSLLMLVVGANGTDIYQGMNIGNMHVV